jgi:hypothetical protein
VKKCPYQTVKTVVQSRREALETIEFAPCNESQCMAYDLLNRKCKFVEKGGVNK